MQGITELRYSIAHLAIPTIRMTPNGTGPQPPLMCSTTGPNLTDLHLIYYLPTYYPFLPIISSYHSPVIHQSIPSPNHKLDNSHKAKLDLPGQTLLFDQLKDISHSVPFSLFGRYRNSWVTPSFNYMVHLHPYRLTSINGAKLPFPLFSTAFEGGGGKKKPLGDGWEFTKTRGCLNYPP